MRMRHGWLSMLMVAALALSFALFRPQPTQAETTPQEQAGSLNVTGYGVLTVKYDTATIQLGVSEERNDATQAYSAMSAAMNKVAAAIQAKGIKEEQLKTGMFALEPVYDYNKDGQQILRGYRATNTVIITTQALDKVPEIIQIAVAEGSNRLNGVTFSIQDTDALTNQALDLAVANAKEKAERVARNLGVTLGRARSISVQDQGRIPTWQWGGGYYLSAGKAMDAAPAPVFSGTGEFSATVSVMFEVR